MPPRDVCFLKTPVVELSDKIRTARDSRCAITKSFRLAYAADFTARGAASISEPPRRYWRENKMVFARLALRSFADRWIRMARLTLASSSVTIRFLLFQLHFSRLLFEWEEKYDVTQNHQMFFEPWISAERKLIKSTNPSNSKRHLQTYFHFYSITFME